MTGNDVTVIGTLVENKLGKGVTKDGRNYINGYIVTTDGTSRIRTDFIAMQNAKNGENPSYRDLLKLMNEGVQADEANNITGSIIKISAGENSSNGRLENADYYDQNGSLIPNTKVTASFPRIVKQLGDKEQMGGVFTFTGYIESIIEEVKNEEVTGRLNVNLVGINYDDSANPISVVIPKEFADAFQGAHMVGQTATMIGQIINIMETRTIETQVAWGTPQTKVQTTFTREFLASGGSGPFSDDDAKNVTAEALAAGKAKREQKLQQAKIDSDARAAAKQTQNAASTGFSGNSNAFSAATATPPANNGRPQF